MFGIAMLIVTGTALVLRTIVGMPEVTVTQARTIGDFQTMRSASSSSSFSSISVPATNILLPLIDLSLPAFSSSSSAALTAAANSSSSSVTGYPSGTTADLVVTASAPSSANRAQAFTVSYTVTNAGPGIATDAELTTGLSSGLRFSQQGSDHRCSVAGDTVRCLLGTFADSRPQTVSVAYTTQAFDACTEIAAEMQALVRSNQADPQLGNNRTPILSTAIKCVAATECRDGIDNDGDGAIDLADPGCESTTDADEVSPKAQCQDGLDNDSDGLIDHLRDAGCASPTDTDERNTIRGGIPQCRDRRDNDGDGRIDYRDDAGCSSFDDTDETDPAPVYACGNGRDDDGDGKTDFPQDPGCSDAADASEFDPKPAEVFACSDSRDNDDDGLIDYPQDPSCTSAQDKSEGRPASAGRGGNAALPDIPVLDGTMEVEVGADRSEAHPGASVLFTVTVRNTSPLDLTDITVEQNFGGSDITVLDAGSAQIEGRVIRWTVDHLPAGDTRILRAKVKVGGEGSIDSIVLAMGPAGVASSSHTLAIIGGLPQTGVGEFLDIVRDMPAASISLLMILIASLIVPMGVVTGGVIVRKGF